jgi:hypothetical protein
MTREKQMQNLNRLIYASAATPAFDPSELKSILEISRKNNALLDVSGMLLYVDGSFFQVLEGDEKVLERLYARIGKDRRHANITKIISEPVAERDFWGWSMGYPQISRSDLANTPGLNDFFSGGSCFQELDVGRARKLLQAFSEGRWRARMQDTKKKAAS